MDPFAEAAYDWSPYRYGYNNPIKFIDPTGMLESTYTDEEGNVITVYNDGDLGVYRHEKYADGKSVTRAQLDKRHKNSTSAGGGPRNRNFTNGDNFTELLRQHSHIGDARNTIIDNVANGGKLSGSSPYQLDGVQGVG